MQAKTAENQAGGGGGGVQKIKVTESVLKDILVLGFLKSSEILKIGKFM